MYRWLMALEARRVLPEAQWRILIRPPPPPALEAFGWHVETTADGRDRISKGGGSDDFASQLLYYPRDRVVIIWTSNNLRQRWRYTLNGTLPRLILDGTDAALLPPVRCAFPRRRYKRGRRATSQEEIPCSCSLDRDTSTLQQIDCGFRRT